MQFSTTSRRNPEIAYRLSVSFFVGMKRLFKISLVGLYTVGSTVWHRRRRRHSDPSKGAKVLTNRYNVTYRKIFIFNNTALITSYVSIAFRSCSCFHLIPLTHYGRLHKHLCLERCVMTSELQLASTCIECGELWLHLKYVLGQFGFVCLFPQN